MVLAALASASSAEPDPREATRSAVGSLQDLEALAQDSPDIHRWASIELPTLLMQGSDTRDPMPATMAALAEALPRAERVTWSEQMHFASGTAPELVADTLRDFLRRHPCKRAALVDLITVGDPKPSPINDPPTTHDQTAEGSESLVCPGAELAAHWIDDHVNTATIGDLDQSRARLRSEDNVRALRGHETTLGVATSNAITRRAG